MTQEQINPELVKWCAELSVPENRNGEKLDWRILVGKVVNGRFIDEEFDPLSDAADREALQMALMKEGNGKWYFGEPAEDDAQLGKYWGFSNLLGFSFHDESFPLLLLRAASAQSGIPMWVGGGE